MECNAERGESRLGMLLRKRVRYVEKPARNFCTPLQIYEDTFHPAAQNRILR